MSEAEQWSDFPMGPVLRRWLGIRESDYKGATSEAPGASRVGAFSSWLMSWAAEEAPENEEHLVEIMDELLGMDLPLAALKVADFNPHLRQKTDFRGELSEGIAAMLASELSRAEYCFRRAQELSPVEPAPYVNLIQIMQHDSRWQEAETWLDAGFRADKNHIPLWELYHRQLEQNVSDEEIARKILQRARAINSWAGMSLAAETDPQANQKTRAVYLEDFYHGGERSEEFLTEYTGAIGVAGEYDRIPQIVWQAEKLAGSQVSWQLLLHGAQAHLALDQKESFIKAGNRLLGHPDLPGEIKGQLRNMLDEVRTEQSGESGSGG